jgi:hypothetical protein
MLLISGIWAPISGGPCGLLLRPIQVSCGNKGVSSSVVMLADFGGITMKVSWVSRIHPLQRLWDDNHPTAATWTLGALPRSSLTFM